MRYVCALISKYLLRMSIPYMLSNSVILIYIIPFILYIITSNPIHFKAFLGVSGTTIITEAIKYFFIGKQVPVQMEPRIVIYYVMMATNLESPVCHHHIHLQ